MVTFTKCCGCTFSDVGEISKAVEESQKVFEVNPWDFEPDFYPASESVSIT